MNGARVQRQLGAGDSKEAAPARGKHVAPLPESITDGAKGEVVVVSRGSLSLGHREHAQEWLVGNLPCARSHVIDGAAHNVHSTNPDEFSELITSMIDGVNR